MTKTLILCGLLAMGPALAWSDGPVPTPPATTPATTPATQPAPPKESEAVRVNGFDFQTVAPVVWNAPLRRRPTSIPVKLKVTNTGDKDLQVRENLTLVLKDASGGTFDMVQEIHYVNTPFAVQMIKKGESVLLECPVKLWPGEKTGTYRLMGPDYQGGTWQIDDVVPGKYTLSVTYENGDGDAAFWNGKATTRELAIEIVKPAPLTTP